MTARLVVRDIRRVGPVCIHHVEIKVTAVAVKDDLRSVRRPRRELRLAYLEQTPTERCQIRLVGPVCVHHPDVAALSAPIKEDLRSVR